MKKHVFVVSGTAYLDEWDSHHGRVTHEGFYLELAPDLRLTLTAAQFAKVANHYADKQDRIYTLQDQRVVSGHRDFAPNRDNGHWSTELAAATALNQHLDQDIKKREEEHAREIARLQARKVTSVPIPE